MSNTILAAPAYILASDRMIGKDHPTYPDTLNAAAIDLWASLTAGVKDTLEIWYVGADSIQVQPGWAIFPNGHVLQITEAITLTFSEILIVAEAASTLYYLYCEEVDGAITWFATTSATVPGGHTAANCLRLRQAIWNNASSNIAVFYVANGWHYYDVTIDAAGSDATEVFDATLSTASDVNCSGFVPSGERLVRVVLIATTATVHSVQFKGSSLWQKIRYLTGTYAYDYFAVVDANGVFTVKNGTSSATRISLWAYAF